MSRETAGRRLASADHAACVAYALGAEGQAGRAWQGDGWRHASVTELKEDIASGAFGEVENAPRKTELDTREPCGWAAGVRGAAEGAGVPG